jgi:hypothetical protein
MLELVWLIECHPDQLEREIDELLTQCRYETRIINPKFATRRSVDCHLLAHKKIKQQR